MKRHTVVWQYTYNQASVYFTKRAQPHSTGVNWKYLLGHKLDMDSRVYTMAVIL